jgi:hypothetical protein
MRELVDEIRSLGTDGANLRRLQSDTSEARVRIGCLSRTRSVRTVVLCMCDAKWKSAPSPVAQLRCNRQHRLRPVRGGKVSAMRLSIVGTGPSRPICERSGVIAFVLNEGARGVLPRPTAPLPPRRGCKGGSTGRRRAATTGIGAVLNTAQIPAGATVLVIGCGGVGLSAIMGAALASASRIIAVDRVNAKLDLARTAAPTLRYPASA